MSFDLINRAAELEASDELHEARLLLLLRAAAGKGEAPHPVEGIMKLAKMDFLLRYPNVLARALEAISATKKRAKKLADSLPEDQRDTIEGRMIRFRYGPWDKRYRRWLAVLVAKNLVDVTLQGRTINIQLSKRGDEVAKKLGEKAEFTELVNRADMVRVAVGDMSATKLKNFVYAIAPEIVTMKWGDSIKL